MNDTVKTKCPDEEMLADYLEGRLSEGEKSQMEKHISDCEICFQAAIIGKDLIKGEVLPDLESVPEDVTQAAVRLVRGRGSIPLTSLWEKINGPIKGLCQWLSDLFGPMPRREMAYMPTRGDKKDLSDELIRFRKTFKEIKTEIEIEKTGEGKALIRVKCHYIKKPGKGIRITLKKGEREIFSELLNDKDYVLFEDVPFGHYNLVFTRGGVELGTCPFEIKDMNFSDGQKRDSSKNPGPNGPTSGHPDSANDC